MKIVAVIQARMGSTRLPGKVLRKVGGKTLLEYQVERVQRASCIDQLVVSTTVKPGDDEIERLCSRIGTACFRGSEEDVLERFYMTASHYEADVVIRITGDCPLMDPAVIDDVTSFFLDHYPQYPYVSNTKIRTYPRGLDVEVFTFKALYHSHLIADDAYTREHVTAGMIRDTRLFKHNHLMYHRDESGHRWTVDTEEDFQLVARIIEHLYPDTPHFCLEDCLTLLEAHPEWSRINRHIQQKKENSDDSI
ncbi:NTP transferase domain-containing protein [Halobacillus litoralis]|uniref:NTP transferase domain-containing protein n=1 Tax=Halobacillus litoralis TaxID=45668 RepID=A0A845E751_9BACI|nr:MULTISPECIES: glycosyltransferase family protein [Halobacillus]MYL21514.1 NTP transferase domain-containing protein [Halobacillus litoralis]MYL30031.1 NTP transferase domain-containing protein [Halobacillus halophilus]MYL37506.1 NTP transferase domain-containing protein [Halobacillus litoralis]